MAHILFICNTYSQMILSIQMRRTIFVSEKCGILISDHSNNSEIIAKRIKKMDIFDEVFYKKTKDLQSTKKNYKEKLSICYYLINGYSLFDDVVKCNYDKMLFYNMDLASHIIFANLYAHNKKIKCNRFEEGVLSYFNHFVPTKKQKLAYLFRRILRRENLNTRIKKFYCTHPDLYEGQLSSVQIPKIETNDIALKEDLKKIFFGENKITPYTAKYIYFSGVYDFEGEKPIYEIDFIKKIANIIGPKNLLVKVHPRDNRVRFVERGLQVDSNSDIPWEVIQLIEDFKDVTFFSLYSGSVISINMLSTTPSQTYFLYNILNMNGNNLAMFSKENIRRLIEKLHKKNAVGWIHIVNDIKEINELVSTKIKNEKEL